MPGFSLRRSNKLLNYRIPTRALWSLDTIALDNSELYIGVEHQDARETFGTDNLFPGIINKAAQ